MKHLFISDPQILDEHPAAQQWKQLVGKSSQPSSIDKLTGKSNEKAIYRLNGVGKGGAPVIAKRAHRRGIFVEQMVYEKILPQVPVHHLYYYGLTEEEHTDFCWLFIEEAVGIPYSESDAVHRALASQWLGVMHATTARLNLSAVLPSVTPKRYLSDLDQARVIISKHLSHPALVSKYLHLLRGIINHFDIIKKHWDEVENFCATIPPCLVHCDFYKENIRVRIHDTRQELNVIDWELSGWGVPAEDIGGLDIDVYGSFANDSGLSLTHQSLQRICTLGLVFRYLACIAMVSPGISQDWEEDAVQQLTFYENELCRLVQSLGWL